MTTSQLTIIAHPETGKLFTETSNPEWSKCQLRQSGIRVVNGVISNASKSAFPLIATSVANDLIKAGLKSGDAFPVEGQIARQLSRVPFYEGQNPVTNPTTGEIVMKDGEQYFMQDVFTVDMEVPSESWVATEMIAKTN